MNRFLPPARVIDLKSDDYPSALLELLAFCSDSLGKGVSGEEILQDLLRRERAIPARLDNSVALPHLRLPLKKKYVFAVGRRPGGLVGSPGDEDKKVTIVFLFLASDKEETYHTVLATLARALEEKDVVARLNAATTQREFRKGIAAVFKGVATRTAPFATRFNQLMLREAAKIARGAKCSSLMLFMDAFAGVVRPEHPVPGGLKTIIVTQRGYEQSLEGFTPTPAGQPDIITVRAFSDRRLVQLRSALLVGLMRGIFLPNERVCCLGGLLGSDKFDIVLVVDLATEFPRVLSSRGNDLLPAGVKAEVFERALGIATELAVEGREGRPVGCILVIGNRDKINQFVKPLILNPFYGYSEEYRNILNPFMDETVKELSSIDGAFIINGDGVIESAGSMLTAREQATDLFPGGLGTRHAAAGAISVAADCITIVVSSSTGQVTLFRHGEPLTLLESPANRRL
ncbi:MAG: diadenylate cyclase [Puniceicoccales bacterium]|jgi:DNA integrity scanning protein DisA with diadenylate cyclase activity/mannitol/fructose-specific phosphotransferase system IIA component (Ntr-type)|nr:diadenylate cyclase [Puniceicoccales bacterium]